MTTATVAKSILPIHVRWCIRRDMPEVYAIENASFDDPWPEEDFVRTLRQRNCIALVAEHDEKIVGFMVYELHKTRLHILNLAVHPDFRRRKVGSSLVNKLIGKLSRERRNRIRLEVRETNLDACLFLKGAGFRAIDVVRGFYDSISEDAYVFQYRFTGAST
jgi:ribosomal-protein-alanine N-acetyltransferase